MQTVQAEGLEEESEQWIYRSLQECVFRAGKCQVPENRQPDVFLILIIAEDSCLKFH